MLQVILKQFYKLPFIQNEHGLFLILTSAPKRKPQEDLIMINVNITQRVLINVINGRVRTFSTPGIPSIAESIASMRKIHTQARNGCPFSIQTIHTLEKRLDKLQTIADSGLQEVKEFIKDNNVPPLATEPEVLASYQISSDIQYVNRLYLLFSQIDLLIPDRIRVARLRHKTCKKRGKYGHGFITKMLREIRSIGRICTDHKVTGITSWSEQGSVKWEQAVSRRLKMHGNYRSPTKPSYNPKYFGLTFSGNIENGLDYFTRGSFAYRAHKLEMPCQDKAIHAYPS